jgi:hypothetical protein
MTSYRRLKWRRPSEEMPIYDYCENDLLIVPKNSNDWWEMQLGHYLGDDKWEYKHSSPGFTTDSVAFWAYIPEPPND